MLTSQIVIEIEETAYELNWQEAMEPFKAPAQLVRLIEHYPDAQLITEVAQRDGEPARYAIARLWLSEGIPFAFKECPAIYESVRTWLAGRLGVDAKEISLAGSARLGTSLSPSQLGKEFNEKSDLDFFIVSNELFEKIRNDFQTWSFDYESGKIEPKNEREAKFWRDNNSRGPMLIQRGYLHNQIVPNHNRYETVKNINQSMWLLTEKLRITELAPTVKKASIVCYSSWRACVQRMVLNLRS